MHENAITQNDIKVRSFMFFLLLCKITQIPENTRLYIPTNEVSGIESCSRLCRSVLLFFSFSNKVSVMKNYSLFLDNPFCVVGGRRKGEGGNCESVLFLLWKQYSGRKLPPFGGGKSAISEKHPLHHCTWRNSNRETFHFVDGCPSRSGRLLDWISSCNPYQCWVTDTRTLTEHPKWATKC